MQQSFGQAKQIMDLVENKALEANFLSIGYYLSTLRQHFPEDCETSNIVADSLKILTQINSALNETSKNTEHLKDLKEKFSHNLNNIKSYLTEQNSGHLEELKDVFQKIDNSFNDRPVSMVNAEAFLLDVQEMSTGSQHLHSMGFDQIVNMINAASIHEPEWMSRTGTLVVLDNNPNTSQALMRRLTREGHTVINAENEFQAMECLRSHSIETILVDYMMFKDSLYGFLKKVEEDMSIGYTPVIIIGPPENMEVMQQITDSGIADYLAKPVNPALLKMRVQASLEKKYAFEQRAKRSQEMQRTRRELEAAIQDLPDGFAIFDQDDHLVMHNDKLFEFYPHLKNQEEMIRGGLTFERFLEANISAGIYLFKNKGKEESRQWIDDKKASFILPACQWEETLVNGLTLGITTYRTPDGGGALVAKDISQDKAQHQDLTFLAYHDSLTGLPNRKAFHQKLNQSILNLKDSENKILAVLFLDLDGFKVINDSYGHEMGDWLLNQVGQRLRRCVRGDDVLARFGGDEFCITLNHASNRIKVEMVATRILKSISAPYIRNDISMTIGVSIGIGIYSAGQDSESLLKQADAAMYTVKQGGKGKYRFYDEIKKEELLIKPEPTKTCENG
ncbi:MAG: diguanylate cyclase domain-containing protein [Candidatus Paracaedibacter sp.]